MDALPVIDVSALVRGETPPEIGAAIRRACEEHGFFYVRGHGVDPALERALEAESRRFFALPAAVKQTIAMARGGRAWRGYFPVGGELTSGRPDLKEGLYFGAELGPEHPKVAAGVRMHGANLFPATQPSLRPVVLAYLEAMTELGHALMRGIAGGLGLHPSHFRRRYMSDPLILFRIFHYPPEEPAAEPTWGVGEHTDYGVLTILKQDDAGGLEVRTRAGWIAAPPLPGAFVCNLGDMLERMTGGLYKSTPHRVRNRSGRGRLSFPFFFDPDFDATIEPLPIARNGGAGAADDDAATRWDRRSVHDFRGTYGDYLSAKVAKVFPELAD